MTRRVFGLLLLVLACKQAPLAGAPHAGPSSLAGTWQGVQSTERNGDGNLVKMDLENAPGGQVTGVLQASYGMDANDLGAIGRVAGPATGGAFTRGPRLPDGGFEARFTMMVTASPSLNHIDAVEQFPLLDAGTFPVYYRSDRR
jgi:hypothetical protein